MNKLFEEWWYNGGSEQWAKTIEEGTVSAIAMVFNEGIINYLESRIQADIKSIDKSLEESNKGEE